MAHWHDKSWLNVVKELGSHRDNGLSDDQIEYSRKEFGDNSLQASECKNVLVRVIESFRHLWVISIIAAALAMFYFNKIGQGLFFVALYMAYVFRTYIEYTYEKKRNRDIHVMNENVVSVIRSGRASRIMSWELVVGDVVVMEKSQMVPADMRLLQCDDLMVNEAAVTGENALCEKYSARMDEQDISIADMKNMLFKGTVVREGSAEAIVTQVGMNTEFGKNIAYMCRDDEEKRTMENRLSAAVDYITAWCLGALAVYMMVSMGTGDSDIGRYVSIGLSAAMPVLGGFIAWLSFLYVKRIFERQGVRIKSLSVIDKLIGLDMMVCDKVGFFTEDKMEAQQVFVNNSMFRLKDLNGVAEENKQNIRKVFITGMLVNDTRMVDGDLKNYKDDLEEIAICEFGRNLGLRKSNLEASNRKVFTIPHDNDRGMMTTVNRVDKNFRANVKGELENILERCTHMLRNGIEREITQEDANNIKSAFIDMSVQNLSVMAYAYRNFTYEPSPKENVESHLVFAGLVGFSNPEKAGAEEALDRLDGMGMTTVTFTGDNKVSADYLQKKLKKQLGSWPVICGVEMDNIPEDDRERILNNTKIFSRISSKQKLDLCSMFKDGGRKFAFTCGRMIDFPCMQLAEVGIGYGNSRMIQNTCDVHMEQKGFGQLIELMENCEKLMTCFQNMTRYMFTCNLAQVLYLIMHRLAKVDLKVNALQFAYFNLVIMLGSLMIFLGQFKYEDNQGFRENFQLERLKEEKGRMLLTAALLSASALAVQAALKYFKIEIFSLSSILMLYGLRFIKFKGIKETALKHVLIVNIIFTALTFFI